MVGRCPESFSHSVALLATSVATGCTDNSLCRTCTGKSTSPFTARSEIPVQTLLDKTPKSEALGPMKLSIVIPAYDKRDTIGRVLVAVAQALPGVAKEVTVVDDCSKDGTREWLQRNVAPARRRYSSLATDAKRDLALTPAGAGSSGVCTCAPCSTGRTMARGPHWAPGSRASPETPLSSRMPTWNTIPRMGNACIARSRSSRWRMWSMDRSSMEIRTALYFHHYVVRLC